MKSLPAKTCVACGRHIEWRKKWARDWAQVKYCSVACRRRGVNEDDSALEQLVLELLGEVRRNSTVSDEDVMRGARRGGSDAALLREEVRRAVRRLAAGGEVEVVQGGRVVDPSEATGTMHVRRV